MQETLLHARRAVLDKLPAVYDERSTLAMSAMSTMLPRPSALSQEPAGLLSSTESKMRGVVRFGIGSNQCKASSTIAAMEKLHANIAREYGLLRQLSNLLCTEVRSGCRLQGVLPAAGLSGHGVAAWRLGCVAAWHALVSAGCYHEL